MKKRMIVVGLATLIAGIANAQWTTSGADVYKTNPFGNVGIGLNPPLWRMDMKLNNVMLDDGIHINNGAINNMPSIYLDNSYGGYTWSRNWAMQSQQGGSFLIRNITDGVTGLSISPTGNVNIGPGAINGKLHSETWTDLYAIRGDNNNQAFPIAVGGYAVGNGAAGSLARGFYGNAYNASDNMGAFLSATGGNTAKGVHGFATGATNNYGGYFETRGSGCATINYGLYATVVAPCPTGGDYAGYFAGDVKIIGSQPASSQSNPNPPPPGPWALEVDGNAVTTAGNWYFSDRRFKENIKPLIGALEQIKKVNAYNYNYKLNDFKEKNFNPGNQIGFIAQELKEIFPELVREGHDGYMAVNYQGMIPVLVQALKEQDDKLQNQQKQIDEQKAMIDALLVKSGNPTGINQIGNAPEGFALDQNVPNPFSNETVIQYSLPSQIKTAILVVYDLSGKQMASMPVNQKETSITITSEKLVPGIYIYSVIGDGKILDTKRMVVAQQ